MAVWRFALHFLVGVLNAILFGVSVWIGTVFALGFVVYELNEDWHLRDHAYHDLAGWLAGMTVAAMVGFWCPYWWYNLVQRLLG